MSLISVADLAKDFWVSQHHRGAFGALRNLVTRQGRRVLAVADLSFSIAGGEMVGYVGPNGAGKSTTIKMLTGILVPTAGRATVAGLIPWQQRRQLAGRIGIVFGQRTQLWWDLPLIESLDLLQHVYRIPAARYRANLAIFRQILDLDSFLATPVRQLSLGQRMRGDLAAALLHEPAILFLDEPTIGLDVVAKQRIRDFLQRINRERGVTVLLTTHDLDDIVHLCQRMLIIDHGRLIYDGAVAAIRQRYGRERTLVVELAAEAGPIDQLVVPGASEVRADGPRRWLRFRRDEVTAAELIAAVTARYAIHDLTIEEPEIEAIVRAIYQAGTTAIAPD